MPEHDKNATPEVTQRPLKLLKSPQFRSIYANNVGFAMTAFDMSLVFGEMLGVEGDKYVIEQLVKVTMAPLHAKIMARVMAHNVAQYEQQFGEIREPGEGVEIAEEIQEVIAPMPGKQG